MRPTALAFSPRLRLALAPLLAAVAFAACAKDDGPVAYSPVLLPALTSVKTTTEVFKRPKTERKSFKDTLNPAGPEALDDYLAKGWGDEVEEAGEPYDVRSLDGSTPPAPGANAKRILKFAHMPDLQLMDDESPTRVTELDSAGATSSALRPQDGEICRMVNASVRTMNALHAKDPFNFLLLGGDNADNAQQNEVGWVLDILGGSANVKCDSGDADDPISGPNNDGKDPFVAPGLAFPFKWVNGNHDINMVGTFALDDTYKKQVLGASAPSGTRNYKEKGAPSQSGDFVIPDARRKHLDRPEVMAQVKAHGDGHGIGDAQVKSGKAIYSFDIEGTNVRFVILDTAAETGGAEGIIHRADVDAYIKPALDDAKAKGKWVFLASHHAVSSLSTNGGTFGKEAPDALKSEEWEAFVGGYTNVVFSIVGHSHEHRVRGYPGSGFWEVMTSAIADYPHEFRVLELYDQDNGWLMLRATCVDFALENDPVAALGRKKGTVDVVSGWTANDGPGTKADRNVELWIKKPK